MTSKVQAEAFLNGVIRPACEAIGLWSDAAGQLLLGTALQESGLVHRRQIGGGPALGLFQMEPITYASVHDDFLRYRPDLMEKVISISQRTEWPDAEWLVAHDQFAAAMARVRYLWAPEKLPMVNDIAAMAKYWSKWYNTRQDAVLEQQFIDNWHATFGDEK